MLSKKILLSILALIFMAASPVYASVDTDKSHFVLNPDDNRSSVSGKDIKQIEIQAKSFMNYAPESFDIDAEFEILYNTAGCRVVKPAKATKVEYNESLRSTIAEFSGVVAVGENTNSSGRCTILLKHKQTGIIIKNINYFY